MVEEQYALTIADLCSTSNESVHTYDYDDHSTIDYVDDDDSFLANNSLCKQHKSAIEMLDSLRKEVVLMARSDSKYGTPSKSPRDVTIDINNRNAAFSSPLGSPVLSRDTSRNKMPLSDNDNAMLIPYLTSENKTASCQHSVVSNDDSTFCSMDNSINHEMNVLKEVAMDLELELKEATVHTVMEAIERIGESDDPKIKSALASENKDVIREGIRNELQKQEQQLQQPQTFLERCRTEIIGFIESFEGGWMNIKVLMVSFLLALVRKCIAAWVE